MESKSAIHRNTVTTIETGRFCGSTAALASICAGFEGSGVEFIAENGGGPNVSWHTLL